MKPGARIDERRIPALQDIIGIREGGSERVESVSLGVAGDRGRAIDGEESGERGESGEKRRGHLGLGFVLYDGLGWVGQKGKEREGGVGSGEEGERAQHLLTLGLTGCGCIRHQASGIHSGLSHCSSAVITLWSSTNACPFYSAVISCIHMHSQ